MDFAICISIVSFNMAVIFCKLVVKFRGLMRLDFDIFGKTFSQ